jgi:hypothetical protein
VLLAGNLGRIAAQGRVVGVGEQLFGGALLFGRRALCFRRFVGALRLFNLGARRLVRRGGWLDWRRPS